MGTTTTESPSDAEVWASLRWPIIVIGLLVGHVTLMVCAVSIALAEFNDDIIDTNAHVQQQGEP